MKRRRRGRTTGADNEAPPTGPIVLDLNGTPIPHTYQHYTTSFVATSSASFISFAFREDPAYLALDDVSVTTGGGPNLIINGGFESGPLGESTPIGWTYLNEFEATYSGVVAELRVNAGPHSGLYYWYDGSTQAYDVITQQIPTSIGHTYTISFWLFDNGGLTTFQRVSDSGLSGHAGNGVNVIVYAGDSQPTWGSGLDACIGFIFEPGNIATDSGAITVPRFPVSVAIVEAAAAADLLDARLPAIYGMSALEPAAAADTLNATVLAGAVMRTAMIAGLSPMHVNSGVPPIKSSRLSSGTALGA